MEPGVRARAGQQLLCRLSTFACGVVLISSVLGSSPSSAAETNFAADNGGSANQKYWTASVIIKCQTVSNAQGNSTYCPTPNGAINCTGKYGMPSPPILEQGVLVHIKTGSNKESSTGCDTFQNAPNLSKWVALIGRGDCKFNAKMQNAARHNASAVIVYNNVGEDIPLMSHDAYDIVSAMIGMDCGMPVAKQLDILADQGIFLDVVIIPGIQTAAAEEGGINRMSVLIVSITFIVLMVFSLAWLVFYYVQRFRFASMKDRMTRQLAEAAKRAIKRIPKRQVRLSDMSESNVCAVCIESYKEEDVVRELPCSHIFHKNCIDPWLIDKRVCPMCKLNILDALGVRIKGASSGSREEEGLRSSIAAFAAPAVEIEMNTRELSLTHLTRNSSSVDVETATLVVNWDSNQSTLNFGTMAPCSNSGCNALSSVSGHSSHGGDCSQSDGPNPVQS